VPDQTDDSWFPGETAPTDGTKFLAATGLGYEIVHRIIATRARYVHVEGDLYRLVEEPEEYWNNNLPLFWRPIPPLPSPERIEAARMKLVLAGRGDEVADNDD
jgi:hypothetical protein